MRTDGQTHMKKLTVGFRNIANAPKNEVYSKSVRNSRPSKKVYLVTNILNKKK
jgi:hypothetical protein